MYRFNAPGGAGASAAAAAATAVRAPAATTTAAAAIAINILLLFLLLLPSAAAVATISIIARTMPFLQLPRSSPDPYPYVQHALAKAGSLPQGPNKDQQQNKTT